MNIPNPRSGAWRALSPLLLLAFAITAQAQLSVSLNIKRRIFIANEPIIATVTIINQTGRDIMLADTEEGKQWFSFQITGPEGRPVPARDPNYELQPLPIKSGETVKRSVNLNEFYQLGDLGAFRATASIFLSPAGKWFASQPDPFDVTEGRLVWKQTVGVPDPLNGPPNNRTFSLLTLDHDKGRMLYVRVVGPDDGVIYGCYNLGRILDNFPPDAKFDSGNNIAILQATARKEYLLSRVNVNGGFIGQQVYNAVKSQPYLRKNVKGALEIVGATHQETAAQVSLEDAPKLSDRPPGFPK